MNLDTSTQNNTPAVLRTKLLDQLRAAQNSDGGWGFHPSAESRVEPTCWAIRALRGKESEAADEISTAESFLKSTQLADGSWPASNGMESGSWITSLACGVLPEHESNENREAIQAGLRWLCEDYPRDSGGWEKFRKKFLSKKKLVEQSDEFRGWGWTPRTSSWVEPTAFALMAFALSHPGGPLESSMANAMAKRRELATGLLYDRVCARGGWNCGNPRVYGVDGDPLVLPTCWALLALRNANDKADARVRSLQWLQQEFRNIQSAGSLAIAIITLESYGIAVPQSPLSLLDWQESELMEQGTHVAAWVAMALDAERRWPEPVKSLKKTSSKETSSKGASTNEAPQ